MNNQKSTEKKLIEKILAEKIKVKRGSLLPAVKEALKKRNKILQLTKKYPTPFYAFDQKALQKAIDSFKSAFDKSLYPYQAFYALKSNPHPYVVKTVLKNGFGLDVSSGRELEIALACQGKKIIFSGPAKTEAELNLALNHAKKVTIHLDSFTELKRLGNLAKKRKIKINVGVRIFTQHHNNWAIKFGIPLTDLSKFYKQVKKYPNLNFQGIQCHKSLNESALPYQKMIQDIGCYLKNNFSKSDLQNFKFVDIGGGYLPYRIDGYYPWDTPQGQITKIVNDYFCKKNNFKDRYYPYES
ncbi:MAG: alanine racemase, partial [Candidatus Buchananbacteria bacterium]